MVLGLIASFDKVKITAGTGNCMINLTNNNDADWAPVWIR
jgi:hypothetical protein